MPGNTRAGATETQAGVLRGHFEWTGIGSRCFLRFIPGPHFWDSTLISEVVRGTTQTE